LALPDDSASQAPAQAIRPGRSLWADAVRRLRRDPAAMACLAVIVVYAVLASVSPWIYPDWATSYDYDHVYEPPSRAHALGTDEFGRSVFQKTILGARTSLAVGLMANVIAIPLGVLLGAIAGFYGRFVDDLIVWLYTTLASIPGIILLIAIRFAFLSVVLFEGTAYEVDLGHGTSGIYLPLAVTAWIGTCRLVRAEVMKIRELDYVLAARATGTRGIAILFRHVLPNVLHIGIIQFSLNVIYAIKAEVILTYLGLGVGTGIPSWGRMIDAARTDLVVGRWWEMVSAVGAFFFLVLALNIFGDRLRDVFDPRLRTA